MQLLGLTGGIGMGKSAAEQLLRQRGVAVIDTDALAREVVAPGQPALEEIRRQFGPQMLGPDGRLRRDEMARRVFTEPAARRQLEELLHPRIRALWQAQVQTWRAEGRPVGVVAIPLLFETQAERELDFTICVACSAATQQQRLQSRGWSLQQMEQRRSAQWPIEKKMALANFVVWSEGGLDLHAAQLDRILQTLAASR